MFSFCPCESYLSSGEEKYTGKDFHYLSSVTAILNTNAALLVLHCVTNVLNAIQRWAGHKLTEVLLWSQFHILER